ncbi:hypothetical protein [Nocardioides mesophilus]|uniref:PKD domain-containing protein n=1 Tax=Nocardioides mesophilus TaxID=433659 RepID=A0A7G9R9K9_9ACTN|nr:hypothetical protein [Nocardioides mesophilus]QNN52284.1 hypothetical protein H9L09_17630 [Nocardioides mesophilus]
MRVRACFVAAVFTLLSVGHIAPSYGDPSCAGAGGSDAHVLVLGMTCGQSSEGNDPVTFAPVSGKKSVTEFVEYQWSSVCRRFDPNGPGDATLDCAAARICSDPVERLWDLWARRPDGRWEAIGSQCFGRPPTLADTPKPTVTPALVLNALRRLGLPAIEAKTQPADKTLVNFETIFYAEPRSFSRTITLLGQRVDIEAEPTQYTWLHGDGTSTSTTTPGAPYPAKEVTHVYSDAYQTVQARVDVTYSARFRVNGGAWQDIAETVTIAGPPTPLRVSEATAVLSGQYE